MSKISFSEQLELEIEFNRSLNPSQMCWVFEYLPEICFFTKNTEGVFTQCNNSTLALFGLKHKKELIGKTDYEIATQEIAEQYRKLDREVIESKQPVIDQIEPVPDHQGNFSWVSTTKVPLFDLDQNVVGVAIIIKNLNEMGVLLGPYQKLNPCIEYIFKHYTEQIRVEILAELANLSIRQLERQFKKLFKVTPLQYINEHRVQMACLLLKQNEKDISDIACEVGFYDHSHFIRLFKQIKGFTPTHYLRTLKKTES